MPEALFKRLGSVLGARAANLGLLDGLCAELQVYNTVCANMALAMSSIDGSVLGPADARQLLRDDDSLLRQIFFNVLKHHHPNLANKVDVIYALSQSWCDSKSDEDFDALEKYLAELKPEESILVRQGLRDMSPRVGRFAHPGMLVQCIRRITCYATVHL